VGHQEVIEAKVTARIAFEIRQIKAKNMSLQA
jgi:hypothetical protein